MYKFGIVGDVHIDTKISSRKDDYFQTCLDKISEVASNCENIIFLGDLFNRPTIPNEYFSQLYNHLNYLKLKGNKFYSIIGNHDIYNELEESLNKTTLGLCQLTNLIEVIDATHPVNIAGYNFYTSYVNLEKAKEHLKALRLNENDVLLLHLYYEDKYEGLCYDDLKNIGSSYIFLGHEHTPFPDLRRCYNEYTIYRCGSLLRCSANTNNLSRDIFYYVFDNISDIHCAKIECMRPSKDVFTEKACTRENLNRSKFLKNINEVIDKYTNNISTQSKFSIKNILESLNTPNKCLEYINEKYVKIGEALV